MDLLNRTHTEEVETRITFTVIKIPKRWNSTVTSSLRYPCFLWNISRRHFGTGDRDKRKGKDHSRVVVDWAFVFLLVLSPNSLVSLSQSERWQNYLWRDRGKPQTKHDQEERQEMGNEVPLIIGIETFVLQWSLSVNRLYRDVWSRTLQRYTRAFLWRPRRTLHDRDKFVWHKDKL